MTFCVAGDAQESFSLADNGLALGIGSIRCGKDVAYAVCFTDDCSAKQGSEGAMSTYNSGAGTHSNAVATPSFQQKRLILSPYDSV